VSVERLDGTIEFARKMFLPQRDPAWVKVVAAIVVWGLLIAGVVGLLFVVSHLDEWAPR
jgi:hypothetical protein